MTRGDMFALAIFAALATAWVVVVTRSQDASIDAAHHALHGRR